MTRLAIVVHRYGEEVGGGAEAYARAIAMHLAADVDVTVLTTCALDYRTWADHYPPGESEAGGVRVLRFSVPAPREPAEFDRLSVKAFAHPDDLALGKRWMAAQGPNAPGLLAHLREEGSSYDAVAFVTYLYATTAEGIGLVADRSILVPTMHDEPPLRLRLYDQVFAHARLLLFLTPEEHELARARFGVSDERALIVGVGIDEPPVADPARFRDATGVRRPYALCLGRLDLSKGVGELLQHHAIYRKARPEGLDLVLLGRGELDLPTHAWLHRTGFVEDEIKHAALAGAAVVVIPSPYESLSLAQLEAWSHGRPTLASAVSPVLVGQSRRAAGGLWYERPEEYAAMLDFLATSPALADAIGRQGRRYVRETYTWEWVRAAWLNAIDIGARLAQPPVSPLATTQTACVPETLIRLDYAVQARPRYGLGRPRHRGLLEIIESGRERYGDRVAEILSVTGMLSGLPCRTTDPIEPSWRSGWLPPLDMLSLYAFIASRQPTAYLEIGSGESTKVARRAIRDHDLATRIVSVDPAPRAAIDGICDAIIRQPLEDADLSVFDGLAAGDVVFFDGSHRAFTNSDVVVFFLDVLPRLNPGVLVGIHDIFLPDDYPEAWSDRFYSEQYMLAAFLMGGGASTTIELPLWYLCSDPGTSWEPVWDTIIERDIERHGTIFWMSIDAPAANRLLMS